MSDRFDKWDEHVSDGAIPAFFLAGKAASPHGFLPSSLVILEPTDFWFDEVEDCWKQVMADDVGMWGDEAFNVHIHLYGRLARFSDAIHPERFLTKYGREKPYKLTDWAPRSDG